MGRFFFSWTFDYYNIYSSVNDTLSFQYLLSMLCAYILSTIKFVINCVYPSVSSNLFYKGGMKEQPLVFHSKVKSSGYTSAPRQVHRETIGLVQKKKSQFSAKKMNKAKEHLCKVNSSEVRNGTLFVFLFIFILHQVQHCTDVMFHCLPGLPMLQCITHITIKHQIKHIHSILCSIQVITLDLEHLQ